jgi:hypothetical protein
MMVTVLTIPATVELYKLGMALYQSQCAFGVGAGVVRHSQLPVKRQGKPLPAEVATFVFHLLDRFGGTINAFALDRSVISHSGIIP